MNEFLGCRRSHVCLLGAIEWEVCRDVLPFRGLVQLVVVWDPWRVEAEFGVSTRAGLDHQRAGSRGRVFVKGRRASGSEARTAKQPCRSSAHPPRLPVISAISTLFCSVSFALPGILLVIQRTTRNNFSVARNCARVCRKRERAFKVRPDREPSLKCALSYGARSLYGGSVYDPASVCIS